MSHTATRLDASPPHSSTRERPSFGQPHSCLECGAPFRPRQSDAEFCSTKCRKVWNNRRLIRGAELYDLFMSLRWDRVVATTLHVFTALSRMSAEFRREDVIERAGRRSWSPAARVIERRPYLRAQRLTQVRVR